MDSLDMLYAEALMSYTLLMEPNALNPARCLLTLVPSGPRPAGFSDSPTEFTSGELVRIMNAFREGRYADQFLHSLLQGRKAAVEVTDEEAKRIYEPVQGKLPF